MKFIHFADCHIDGFKDQKLSEIGFKNFTYVIDQAIDEEIDFVLLAGDLFNTALPRVDALKRVVADLKRLQDNNIPVYAIPGSHDFSPHGKTMLDVIELAGLLINVMQGEVDEKGVLQLKPVIDPKTNAQITGIIGKRGMLDKQYYERVHVQGLDSNKPSIFMFHTAITEMKSKDLEKMESQSVSFLPPNFTYYAGGHVHVRQRYSNAEYKSVVYPGPTFPNSFSELEQLQEGSFVFYDDEQTFEEGRHYTHINIPSKKVITLTIDCEGKTPIKVEEFTRLEIDSKDCDNAIVLLRFIGTLSEGKPQDINMQETFLHAYQQGAFIVLKNSYKLLGKLFEEIDIPQDSTKDVEEATITEHVGQVSFKQGDEQKAIAALIENLNIEQFDGEKKTVFIERVLSKAQEVLEQNENS